MSIVGKSSQYYSGFSPTSIAGCALWLDAADSNSLTLSGSNVTSWRDKSGNGANATGVNNPTYLSASIGIDFVIASSQYMTLPNSCLPFGNSGYSYFFIFTPKTNTAGQQLMVGGALTTAGDSIGMRTGDAGTGTLQTYWNNYDLQTTTRYTLNVKNFGAFDYKSGGARRIWINFTQGATDTPAVSRTQTISNNAIGRLGALSTGYFGGQMHEIIAYNDSLPTADRQAIEGYLAAKWGLRTNVPATHPFKTLAPFTRPFVPVDISGCSLWLDAADNTSLTLSGSNVTTWFDKSGNARNAVVSSNAFATLTGTPQGLLFNNSFYTTTLSADPAIETGFVVYNVSSAGVLVGSYNAGREIAFQSLTIVGVLKAQIAWGAVATGVGNVRQMVTTFASSSATSSAVNGGTAVTAAGLTFTSGNVTTLGREVGTNFPYGGFIHEIVLFNVNLTTPQRQEVETYLANKWGLRGLTPAGHYARLSPALTMAFLPPQVGTCSVWLDSADLTTLTLSGSNVTAWRDKSGTGANATFTGTHVYSSANRYVQTPGGSGFFTVPCDLRKSTTSQCSVFTVHKWLTNNGGNQSLWGTDVGGGWNRIQLLAFPGASQYAYGLTLGNASPNTYPVNGLNTLNTVIYSAIYDLNVTNGTSAHVDGLQNALFTEGAPTTQTSTQLTYFGEGGGGAFNTQIGFSEIIIFRFKLTTQQRQQVEGYLANKWGLTSKLPVVHPFKTLKP